MTRTRQRISLKSLVVAIPFNFLVVPLDSTHEVRLIGSGGIAELIISGLCSTSAWQMGSIKYQCILETFRKLSCLQFSTCQSCSHMVYGNSLSSMIRTMLARILRCRSTESWKRFRILFTWKTFCLPERLLGSKWGTLGQSWTASSSSVSWLGTWNECLWEYDLTKSRFGWLLRLVRFQWLTLPRHHSDWFQFGFDWSDNSQAQSLCSILRRIRSF